MALKSEILSEWKFDKRHQSNPMVRHALICAGVQITTKVRIGYVCAGTTSGFSWDLRSPCHRRVSPCWRNTDDRDVCEDQTTFCLRRSNDIYRWPNDILSVLLKQMKWQLGKPVEVEEVLKSVTTGGAAEAVGMPAPDQMIFISIFFMWGGKHLGRWLFILSVWELMQKILKWQSQCS